MKILFKSDTRIFYIDNDQLFSTTTDSHIIKKYRINMSNIRQLDDVEVLYHYRAHNGFMYPVYYEHNGRFISDDFVRGIPDLYTKDYTLVNFKLLDDI